MPVLVIHRREYALWTPDGSYRCAVWIDYHFDPPPMGWASSRSYRSDAEFIHTWTALPDVAIETPPGARRIERPTPRGPESRLIWPRLPGSHEAEEWGLDAHICVYLAERGERGFVMAKRRQDDGPTLFDAAPEAAAPEVGAYGPARRGGSAAVAIADLADDGPRFAHTGAAIDRAERLERAIREALPWLVEMGGRPPMPLTAHNILHAALEAPGGAGEAA